MQGFIIRVQKVRDEDCIVYILTKQNIIRGYRFYGARHSKITHGYKIDFELEESPNFMPRIINTMHLGFKWLLDRNKLFLWQEFLRLFYTHLKDVEDVDSLYFDVLDECAKKLDKQNAKRLFLEAYIKILKKEGRLHKEKFCFLCDEEIDSKNIALARAFLPAHENCINKKGFNTLKIDEFFESEKTFNLSDDDVYRLYQIVLEGF
ncbi:putative RecO family recombination protein [Campylobacter blaseri]|uniref:Recombination protein RecO n=1 Tax=Campylobacter blaseri TaxID=2042961 RepID=A0A2P8QZB5_9BACT|nr:recombination protein RecO [Campylobacter blaseri]PSM51587.1 recombination protein RecO [Campylobacter blaseri]PSM53380.1 recombination protein RecO [Campylobacter blaseri]QKF86675.1 putative RecO family recombination protein [Campylobacter blaseri]